LIVAMFAQVAWWERQDLLRWPGLRVAADALCNRVGCELPLPRIPGTIEILQPTLGSHPLRPGSLRLMLTLINRAPRTQRYPILQLELYDERAELLAARRFTPDLYLLGSDRAGLGAGLGANLTLNLAIPETPPAGFRLRLF
jgi:hypothetical protein